MTIAISIVDSKKPQSPSAFSSYSDSAFTAACCCRDSLKPPRDHSWPRTISAHVSAAAELGLGAKSLGGVGDSEARGRRTPRRIIASVSRAAPLPFAILLCLGLLLLLLLLLVVLLAIALVVVPCRPATTLSTAAVRVQQRFVANLAFHWDSFVNELAADVENREFEVILTAKRAADGQRQSWLIRPLPELQAIKFCEALRSHAAFPKNASSLVDTSLRPVDLIRFFGAHQDELSGILRDVSGQLAAQTRAGVTRQRSGAESSIDAVDELKQGEKQSLENVEKLLDFIGYRLDADRSDQEQTCPLYRNAEPDVQAFFDALPRYANLQIEIRRRNAASTDDCTRPPADTSLIDTAAVDGESLNATVVSEILKNPQRK